MEGNYYGARFWRAHPEQRNFVRILTALFASFMIIVPLIAYATPSNAGNAPSGDRLPWEEFDTGGAGIAAVPGQGFTLNAADLAFILDQIKIAEQHALTATASNPCGTLIGPGPNQIPAGPNAELQLFGLRTIDGSCNNLVPGQERFGAADEPFRRLAPADYRDADVATVDWDGPIGPLEFGDLTSYATIPGIVEDAQPRLISNLIVDQTSSNPAAVSVAGPGAIPDPDSGTLPIPNVAPDEGLSAPFNDMLVFFGQFFDHGLDLTTKSGSTVFMPLIPGDPLYDPMGPNFMAMSRATNAAGDPLNLTTPFVDQQQTYGSTPSQNLFLREYEANLAGDPVSTGKMLEGEIGGLATWSATKAQAADLLGIQLVDADALSIPLMATDPYGKFIPGTNGYPQIVSPGAPGGLLEGDPTANGGLGVLIPADAVPTGHAFLIDIAHQANPAGGKTADLDSDLCRSDLPCVGDYFPGGGLNGQYDDEMLNAHFICGDGRCNENVGLSAVHLIFHAEHNRLVDDIKALLLAGDPAVLVEWELAPGIWDGERILQAARFVTEMEYQHLAFEEFARTIQPAVNVFDVYDASIDPAISIEFSQAVYRFGHSLLPEVLARYNLTGPGVPLDENNIRLFDAFLNPPAFFDADGSKSGGLTPEQGAGALIRGLTTQVAQEMDEFTIDAVRNTLVGLPLDLAAINIARGRDFGLPRLNDARRAFFAQSGSNPSLTPYTSWADFGLGIRNPESLVNFIAAYGLHQTIVDESSATDKRAAAQAILDLATLGPVSDPDYADRVAFMNSTDGWASSPSGVTITGLGDVDLWIGGLAERQEIFGGLLGSTFNFVFERQMEDLQDGDRFYYLFRTGGMNLGVQLEGNSFSELVERNTDVENLPANIFTVPTYFFDMAVQGPGISDPIVDDPATPYDETLLLTRQPDGEVRYSGADHANFAGSAGDDRMRAGEGDDTVRGNAGNDVIEGDGGNDVLIGGPGNDIITDLFGEDDLKGGDGNDALQSGPGIDLLQAGRGADFLIGGTDGNVHIAGEGNDFIFGGDSADAVHADDGDDWLEGGAQSDFLEGDSGLENLLAEDINDPGHDVIDGDGGDDRTQAEGGDDIMIQGPGIDRFFGQFGFDWVTNYAEPLPGFSDLALDAFLPPGVIIIDDRFSGVEALSGWDFDDVLRGDSLTTPLDLAGHELDAAGIARIDGLSALLNGATSFTGGNIIIGGSGSDTLEGRGGDDFLDGDASLRVQLLAPVPAGGTQLVDSMLDVQADVFAGLIDPGDISIVRVIDPGAQGADVDTAVFSGPLADYDIQDTVEPFTVTHARGIVLVNDGTDTLKNIEFLQFSDQTIAFGPAGLGPDTTPPAWASFNSTDVPVDFVDLATVTSTIDVTGVGTVTDVNVSLTATHTRDGDLHVFLNSPGAIQVELFSDLGGTGDDFTGTVLDDEAPTSITTGAPPFTGTFSPVGLLSDFDTEPADGTWTLELFDHGSGETGQLLSWSLDFDGGDLIVSNETISTIDLDWSGASDDVGVVDYNVYQDGGLIQTGVVGTSTTVTGLAPTTSYSFTVQAVDAALNESVDGPSASGMTIGASDFFFSTLGSSNAVPGVAGTPDDADTYMWTGSGFARTWDGSAAGLFDEADVDGLSMLYDDTFFVSFNTSSTDVPTVGVVQDEDIVQYTAGVWSLLFDGSAAGLTSGLGVDAIDVVGTDIYFSTAGITSVPGVGGIADDADIYMWDGSSFSRVFDASVNGLAASADVDGLTVVGPDNFFLSFKADISVPMAAQDEDIVQFDTGTWSTFFDGTATGLTPTDLDMDAIHVGSVTPAPPVDTTDPTVSVTAPTNTETLAAPVMMAGLAGDNVGVTSVQLEIYDRDTAMWWNGAAWQAPRTSFSASLGGGTWSYDFDPGPAAVLPYWSTVQSFDAAGNESVRAIVNFTISTGDIEAPTVSVTAPANTATVSAPVMMEGLAADNVGVASVQLEIYDRDTAMWWDGAAWQAPRTSFAATSGGGTWSYDFDPGPAAVLPYWSTIQSFDAAGNESVRAIVNFTIGSGDLTAPVLTLAQPVEGGDLFIGADLISGTATDAVGVTQVRLEIYDRDTTLWWNGAAWQAPRTSVDAVLGAGTWSYDFLPSPPATTLPYWLTVQALDSAGNESVREIVNFSAVHP